MLLRGETNFLVRSLRHYSVLILIFLIWNMVTKLKSKNYITSLSQKFKKSNNFKICQEQLKAIQ